VALLLVWTSIVAIRGRKHARKLSSTAIVIAFSSATFYYPAIVNSIMSIFTCMPLDPATASFQGSAASHHGWWKQDYDSKCFTGGHMVFAVAYGLPFVLLFAVGAPLFITHFLWRHHTKGMLNNSDFQAKFGYMYTDFREGCWFWFCMRFWLLLALSAAIQGLSYYGALRQLITVALCLSLILLLHLACKPYESTLVNSVQMGALYSVLVTVFLAFAYATPSTYAPHRGTMYTIMVLNGAVIFTQLVVIAFGLVGLRKVVAGLAKSGLSSTRSAIRSVTFSGRRRLGFAGSSGGGGGAPLPGADPAVVPYDTVPAGAAGAGVGA
jgi:hypothetical protein